MLKANRFIAIIALFLFVVIMGSCGGGGGGGGDGGGTETTPPTTTQGDISLYSAGDIEDPNFNGTGIDEGVGISTLSTRRYDVTITSEACGPMGTGYKGFAANNCTEWVAVRRCERGDAPVIWRGNGGQWLANADATEYEIGTVPKVGAIAVFQLSYDPCPGEESCKNKALYEYGHVAYAENVNGNEWCISEYNYLNPLAYGERCFSQDNKAPALIGFIYGLKTSPSTDTVSPSNPTGLTGNAISSSQINLSWTASTDNVGVAGYKIYRNGFYLKSVPTYLTSDTGLSPSTGYCYTVSAYDAAGNESSQSNQACVTTTPSSGSAEAFGTYLGEFNGIAAYSNGNSIYYCPDEYPLSECQNYVDNKYTGIKWQCVEYVRRYYLIVYGMNLYVGYMDAKDFYDKASDMDLDPYPNGGAISPQIGDILISEGAPSGHVAIVKSVYNNYICTIQQNYFLNDSDGTNVCLTLTLLNGKYTVGSFSTNYPIKGWLRNPSLLSNTSPTATISSPSDGSTYTQGESITFSGSGYDAEDGTLSGGSLVWTSSIDGQIGAGTSFAKSNLSEGTHTITLTATDSNGATGSVSKNIIVTESTTPLSITTTSLPSGAVGVSYGANLSATGGKTPYTWSLTSGSLPLGLSLSTGGLISGTPTTAGTYNFTVKVTDNSSPQQTDSKALSVTITSGGYSISGRVTLNGSGLSGVTITLTGTGSTSTTTNSDGYYTFTGAQNGSYMITPSKSGYTFTPSSRSITVNNADMTGQDFTATSTLTYSISGRVTLNGSGISGVTITLTGTGSTSTTTDSNGNYAFAGAQNGSYTITPSKSGYTFTPSNRSITVNNADMTGQDFTATQITAGVLSVSPSERFDSTGLQGGPFTPSNKTYTLTNTGGTSINWTASKGQSWVSLSSTSGSLSSGGSTTVTVSINSNANSLSPGNYVDTVSFTNTTNGNGNTTRTVNLTVNYNTPTITVGPTSLNFGSVQVGTCGTATFAIQHISGTGPASGTVSASPNPPFSITSGSSFSVSNGSAANVTVQFCPTSSGTFNGTATVSSSATFTGTNTITLTGTGFSGGVLAVTPSDRFDSSGSQGGPFTPSSKTYTLSNTGGSPINWTASKGQNWVTLSSTSGTLSPGGSTTVTVSINSSANSLTPSNYVDTVSFTNTTNGNGNATRTVNLTVTYSTPTITIGPTSLNFGNVQVGTCSTAVFAIQHVVGTGPASGTVSASPNPPFSITSGSSFSVSNGSAANVTVQFCPTSSGTFNGTATVSSSATFTGTNTVTLTGTGTAPSGVLSVSPTDRFDSSGLQGGPFSPSSKTYTLSNTGGSSINWTASKGQSWVSLSATSGTLSSGGSTTVTVSINSNANSLSPGNYVDIVNFTNTTNGNGNTTRTVNLTVNYPTPTITVGPTSLNFGSVAIGTCETAVFVIQHVLGTGPASGTVSASPNPPFSITSGSSFSVSNGSAANVTVQFCPTSVGTFNGTATVSSSANFTGTNTVTLTGSGVY